MITKIVSCWVTMMLHMMVTMMMTMVRAETLVSESMDSDEDQYMQLAEVETVEEFMKTREFKAIVGGCACFWGSIFGMGMTYMLVVLLKRSFEPQEIKIEED